MEFYEENNCVYINKSKSMLIECKDKLIENFVIDKNTTAIAKEAFKDCKLLKSVNLVNDHCVEIQPQAFPEDSLTHLYLGTYKQYNPRYQNAFNMKNVKTITFAEKAEFVYLYYFESAPSLEEIIIEKPLCDNDCITYSKDGVVYTKLNEEDCASALIFYPLAKKDKIFKIPEDVMYILEEGDGIVKNPFLETLIFPEELDEINWISNRYDKELLCNCDNLKQIVMPNLSEHIYLLKNLCPNCPSLETIYTNSKDIKNDGRFSIKPMLEYEIDNAKSFKEINSLFKGR